ncbi:MAG TPA: helix-hairpin-helix domain-containing protein [Polyangiaceae bacterium]|nr:helix-hairpin-helix domain-containing protein [Polyangiaceae bacterium]
MSPAASNAQEASEAELRGNGGGGLTAPASGPSWFGSTLATLRNSVWAPVALKLVLGALAMLALSGIGVASMLSRANGVQIPLASMLGSDLNTTWLGNESRASAPANSTSSALSATPVTLLPNASASVAGPLAPALSNLREGTREGSASTPASPSAGMTEDGKVILNLASAQDLRHLPGVGAKRAEAILALRARLGRFKQVSDLLRVKGIGVRGLKKISPHVVLDAPKPSA